MVILKINRNDDSTNIISSVFVMNVIHDSNFDNSCYGCYYQY